MNSGPQVAWIISQSKSAPKQKKRPEAIAPGLILFYTPYELQIRPRVRQIETLITKRKIGDDIAGIKVLTKSIMNAILASGKPFAILDK